MSTKAMEDNMIICFNAKVWTEQEKEEILQNAMKKYLKVRRCKNKWHHLPHKKLNQTLNLYHQLNFLMLRVKCSIMWTLIVDIVS